MRSFFSQKKFPKVSIISSVSGIIVSKLSVLGQMFWDSFQKLLPVVSWYLGPFLLTELEELSLEVSFPALTTDVLQDWDQVFVVSNSRTWTL